ncbi:MAG TPA: periplasmic heavy metal sensor [Armatimonadota bacterium]|nr:periplasmic heavy metal sensor [Armatimonadota bacterium]HOM71150.1 periplasmic heavy metal sensor [Armatimonadota bacterium]HPP76338.1 periplasmic heavy metal sensor [Armatimonadota bacterium]
MKKLVVPIVVVVVMISMAALVWSQTPGDTITRPGGQRNTDRPGEINMWRGSQGALAPLSPPFTLMSPRGMDMLNLTDDQKTTLTKAMEDYRKELEANQPKIQAASTALRTALTTKPQDSAAVRKAVNDAKAADEPMIEAQIKLWGVVCSTLTAEQMKTLTQPMGFGTGGFNRNRTSDSESAR